MASIPQYCSNYLTKIPASEFCGFSANPGVVVAQDSWNGEDLLNSSLYYGNGWTGLDQYHAWQLQSSPESDTTSSATVAEQLVGISNSNIMCASFSDEQLSNMMGYLHGVEGVHDHNFNTYNNNNNYYYIVDGYDQLQQNYVLDSGEEGCGFFRPDFKPPIFGSVVATENLGMQNTGNQMQAIEETNSTKVVRYSEEEKKERILRYLKKRNQRNFNKTIKYACRKTLADRRVRVRGRFAKNNKVFNDHHDNEKNINDDSSCNNILETDLCCNTETDAIQMKYNDEEWLQEAMASLVSMP